MIYPDNFEEKIGFNRIRELLNNNCLSSLGMGIIKNITFEQTYTTIEKQLKQTNEFKQICLFEDHFPLQHFYDLRQTLQKISIEGTYIEAHELFDLKRSLETLKNIHSFFNNKEEGLYPYLKDLVKEIKVHRYVIERINGIISKHGEIRDTASPELKKIRQNLDAKISAVGKRINAIFKQAQKNGFVEKDATLTIRNGRSVIPVTSKQKRKINGYVHDESATGQTAYIEPAEIVELNNEIRELEYAEQREIIKILIAFSDDIRPYKEELTANYDQLAEIDFIRAKAMVAIKLNAILPVLQNDQQISWKNARHPLLYLAHKAENKETVPLNLTLNTNQRILVISGPNAGGKSVCLKAVGLIQYMFQCGLLVPMDEGSEMGIFEKLFINIGDDQSIENDLSTYSSFLLNMKHFTENATNKTLFLIDELGTGTEPRLGGAIAEAILISLNEKGCFGVTTTHYSNIKQFATETQGLINGAMLFDVKKMKPLYKLQTGEPGSSFAFEIAQQTGLERRLIEKAKDLAGKEYISFDQQLKDIAKDRSELARIKKEVTIKQNQLDATVKKYLRELKNTKQLREDVLSKAQTEAQNLLNNANKTIENTIREIKETNADRQRTQEARQQVNKIKKQITGSETPQDYLLNSKLRAVSKNAKQNLKKEQKNHKKHKPLDKTIRQGDKVKLKGQEAVGKVLEVTKNIVKLEMGSMITQINKERLEKINDETYQKASGRTTGKMSTNIQPGTSKIDFKPEIDIRGKRADEAMTIVRSLIDNAIVVRESRLKIIHGKGNGILKQIIRDYLKTEEAVNTFKDEEPQYGGSGATIIELDI
jgi:DNA mismatch repair protein MutS2